MSAPTSARGSASPSRIRNKEIGFIFQAFNLTGGLTIYEHVELPLTCRGVRAVVSRPLIMLADDPTGSLDPRAEYKEE